MARPIDPALGQIAVVLDMFATPVTVTRNADGLAKDVPMFARGLRGTELMGGAYQSDRLAVFRVSDWEAQFGATPPVRFDKMALRAGSFSVEDVRAAPETGQPVFFKVLLRGGRV